MATPSIFQWLENLLNPLASRIARDLEAMRADTLAWKEKLEPLPAKEWDLLSRQFIAQPGRKPKKGAPIKGLFATIYQEPVVAWSYKEYPSKTGKVFILVACTRQQEYLYKHSAGETEIIIGPYRVGALGPDGRLISSRKKELLAQVGQANGTYSSVAVYGREVGGVALPQETQAPMPRAFTFLAELNEKERDLFLSLAILLLVRQKIA